MLVRWWIVIQHLLCMLVGLAASIRPEVLVQHLLSCKQPKQGGHEKGLQVRPILQRTYAAYVEQAYGGRQKPTLAHARAGRQVCSYVCSTKPPHGTGCIYDTQSARNTYMRQPHVGRSHNTQKWRRSIPGWLWTATANSCNSHSYTCKEEIVQQQTNTWT